MTFKMSQVDSYVCRHRRFWGGWTLVRFGSAFIICSGLASANVILDWNIKSLETTASVPFNPPLETRNIAIVHAAMFDAVNATTGEYHPYIEGSHAPSGASPEAAAVAAAHFALAQLYPTQKPMLDAAYATSLTKIPDGRAKTDGIYLGETVAARLLVKRASDGADRALTAPYIPNTEPGAWRPTPPAFLPAMAPGWGAVVPFVLKSPAQFRPAPPPRLGSKTYTRDFVEIKELGSAISRNRTTDETNLARLWIATAAQNWNPILRQLVVAHGLDLVQTARAFALLNLAGADAFIVSWNVKYTYNQWRPVTAIRAADTDDNPDTLADSTWTPLLITPPFPDYVAGHTVYAGAAARVLEDLFGRCPSVVIELKSATAPGVVRTYTRFEDIADDVVYARIVGGIHWRTSSEQGKYLGQQIGQFAAKHLFAPQRRHGEKR